MAVLTAEELEQRKKELIIEVNKYKDQVNTALEEVAASLARGEYAHACSVMGTLSSHQAKASVQMRTILIKNGFMARENPNG